MSDEWIEDRWVTTKAGLMAHIARDWGAINALLDRLSERQLTHIRSADGWAVKDHIAHLTAWENSIVAFLNGRPRHTGLGVPEAVYLGGDLDAMNAIIFEQHRDEPLAQVRARFQSTHDEALRLLAALADDDVHKPYVHFLPDEPGQGDGPPALNVLYGNTAHHYRLHQMWIEVMLRSAATG